jgi:hypothetical protein
MTNNNTPAIYITPIGPGFAAGVFDGTPDQGSLLRDFIAATREEAIQQAQQWIVLADVHHFIPGDFIKSKLDDFYCAVVVEYRAVKMGRHGELPGYLVELPSGKLDWIGEDQAVFIAGPLPEGEN